MSEKQNNQFKNSAQSYSFYWNYNDQLAIDRREKEKKGKRKLLIYGIVLTVVLVVFFALFATTFLWFTLLPCITLFIAHL